MGQHCAEQLTENFSILFDHCTVFRVSYWSSPSLESQRVKHRQLCSAQWTLRDGGVACNSCVRVGEVVGRCTVYMLSWYTVYMLSWCTVYMLSWCTVYMLSWCTVYMLSWCTVYMLSWCTGYMLSCHVKSLTHVCCPFN